MIVLVAHYYAQAGQGDAVATLLQEMTPQVLDQESGCIMYQVCRAADDPDAFLLYEQYADDAAVQAHRATPHFKEIIQGKVIPMLAKREVAFYELIAPSPDRFAPR